MCITLNGTHNDDSVVNIFVESNVIRCCCCCFVVVVDDRFALMCVHHPVSREAAASCSEFAYHLKCRSCIVNMKKGRSATATTNCQTMNELAAPCPIQRSTFRGFFFVHSFECQFKYLYVIHRLL